MKKTNYDYIVIGGGTHGLSSTFHLSNLSSSVALFEQFTIGHEKGSSHGPTRINRSAYEELFYTKLNRLCLQ